MTDDDETSHSESTETCEPTCEALPESVRRCGEEDAAHTDVAAPSVNIVVTSPRLAEPEPEPEPVFSARGWTALGPYRMDRTLKEGSLVLQSMGVSHHRTYGAGGGYLVVRDADYDRARDQLDRYEEENRDFPPRRKIERSRYAGPPLIALAFIALVAFAWFTGPVAKPNGPWFSEGASVGSLVLSSQPYRAVTALTLHADGAHVLSNLLSGVIFGRAVERRFGPGTALFSILAAGTAGNVLNAVFYAAQGIDHRSIGASTAVFGAVGLLATSQLLLGGTQTVAPDAKRHWTEFAAPVIGGLALLGALGAGPQTDIFAHAFGLLAGMFIAIPVALWLRRDKKRHIWRAPSIAMQAAIALLSLGVVGGSWALALA